MPISLRVDVDDWTVHVIVDGSVTPADVAAAMEETRQEPRVSPSMRRLVDCRTATVGLSSDEIRKLAFAYAKDGFDPALRVAVVVTTDVAAGLCRTFAGYAALSVDAFAVFRELAQAREWLGLGPARAA